MLRSLIVVAALAGSAAAAPTFVLVPRATPLRTAPRADAAWVMDPLAGDPNAGEDRRCFAVAIRSYTSGGDLTVCFRTRDLKALDGVRANAGGGLVFVASHAQVAIDPAHIAITGDETPAAVARVVDRMHDALRACYGHAEPRRAGALTIRLEINAAGVVEHLAIVHGFQRFVDDCVSSRFAQMHFPAGRATVTLPLSFAP